MKHLLFVPAFALLAAMALVGCSDDNGGTDPRIPATSVVVDVTEQELHVGETLQLTATPTPANTTDKVQWTSDDPATATVSETGLVTAVALGSTSVKAVCGEVSATCVIRVVEPDPSELYDIISFEEEEGMTDIGGQKVTLGDIEVVGGFAEGVYSNVFWAKPYAEYGDPEGIMGLTIDLRCLRPTETSGSAPTIATVRVGGRKWIPGAVSSCRGTAIPLPLRSIMPTSFRSMPNREPTAARPLPQPIATA